ncbi:uncharacterized protein LOC126747023 [Anthonomus grandis grandis]|uniref:uncharacterized protein LOC126747023 n=1 Tax=Anthonomus grandis grandis TaxID=2921223 RepID=UPI0021669A2A|nr:uncharacterized protein LOC126747023 [Anthonomus grandis grandis]
MRFSVLIFAGLVIVTTSEVLGVPISVLNNEIIDSLEEDDSSPVLEDDITTRGLARLSSAATCLVAGVEYTHGQQIYRADQCEFCLCLDGEMFCWWQDCPPTMEGPCKNQGPFSPCTSVPVAPTTSSSKTSSTSPSIIKPVSSANGFKSTKSEPSVTTGVPVGEEESTSLQEESTAYTEDDEEEEDTSESDRNSTELSGSTEGPKSCVVMGQEYQEGDNLPHSTGNCLECVCAQGGKITCSPHQCVPAGDEITDYHQQGAPQGNDVF